MNTESDVYYLRGFNWAEHLIKKGMRKEQIIEYLSNSNKNDFYHGAEAYLKTLPNEISTTVNN